MHWWLRAVRLNHRLATKRASAGAWRCVAAWAYSGRPPRLGPPLEPTRRWNWSRNWLTQTSGAGRLVGRPPAGELRVMAGTLPPSSPAGPVPTESYLNIPSEELVARKWDRCVSNLLVNTAVGSAVGVVLSFVFAKRACLDRSRRRRVAPANADASRRRGHRGAGGRQGVHGPSPCRRASASATPRPSASSTLRTRSSSTAGGSGRPPPRPH